MKEAILQFDTLPELAGFSKLVRDRGYVIVIKDLTLRCQLDNAELAIALQQYGARLMSLNKVAA